MLTRWRCGSQRTLINNYIAYHKVGRLLLDVTISSQPVFCKPIRTASSLPRVTYSRGVSASGASLCEDIAPSQSSPQESRYSPSTRMGLIDEARQTLRHLLGVHRSETEEYELLPEAERAVVTQVHTFVSAVRVYRGCCPTCVNALRSAAIRPGSPRTSV